MFDRFDLSTRYSSMNKTLSFCQKDQFGGNVLDQYTAWCELCGIADNEYLENKEAFLSELIDGNGNLISRILNSEEENSKKQAQIEFLYSDIDFITEFQKLNENIIVDTDKMQSQLSLIKDPSTMNLISNLTLDEHMDFYYHISHQNRYGMQMYYFQKRGTFLSIGIDFDLETVRSHNHNELLPVFKVLSDESRLEIVKKLAKKEMTSSQLAETVGITLPTINHHLKQLCAYGIVGIVLSTQNYKGTVYKLEKNNLREMLEEFLNEIS